MRLLQVDSDGKLSLNEFWNDKPPYAILSHTWGVSEVLFQDIGNGTAKSKDGYVKIEFLAQKAAERGLRHFWIDTCCIDKSSSLELQTAINSMFQWYRDAAVCFVYMADVFLGPQHGNNTASWEVAFSRSRWFRRGWTLQELLAPTSVEFLSAGIGAPLGDKKSLERHIVEITGIPAKALQGQDLHFFSIDERMRWAQNRETTREEDEAYSLMGLFGVFIPILYGEGKQRAFERLREEIDKRSKDPSSSKVPQFGNLQVTGGIWDSRTFRHWREADFTTDKTIDGTLEYSKRPIQEPFPMVVLGMKAIDLSYAADMSFHATIASINGTEFTLRLSTEHKLYAGQFTWLAIPKDDNRICSGTLRYPGPGTDKVLFPRSFQNTPKVVVWISGLNFERYCGENVEVFQDKATKDGFTIYVHGRQFCRLREPAMSWIAFTDDSGICNGEVRISSEIASQVATSIVDLPPRKFQKQPQVFAAFKSIDLSRDGRRNARIKLVIDYIDPTRFELVICAWADSVIHGAVVQWIAIPSE